MTALLGHLSPVQSDWYWILFTHIYHQYQPVSANSADSMILSLENWRMTRLVFVDRMAIIILNNPILTITLKKKQSQFIAVDFLRFNSRHVQITCIRINLAANMTNLWIKIRSKVNNDFHDHLFLYFSFFCCFEGYF